MSGSPAAKRLCTSNDAANFSITKLCDENMILLGRIFREIGSTHVTELVDTHIKKVEESLHVAARLISEQQQHIRSLEQKLQNTNDAHQRSIPFLRQKLSSKNEEYEELMLSQCNDQVSEQDNTK